MVYYSLARSAGSAFLRGFAGSLGRRAGNYRRRRRYVLKRSRASNVRRSRTFTKKTRVRGTRSIRRLWTAVRALQRTNDPDVTIRDILPTTVLIDNDNTGGESLSREINLNTQMLANLTTGSQYKLKSFNQRFVFRLTGYMNSTNNDQIFPTQITRNLRVMFVLFKDEVPDYVVSSIFNGYPGGSTTQRSSGDSIYPAFMANPGYQYRILYDKVYRISFGRCTQAMIRLPASVFYDQGQVKFREEGGNMVQQNNFLYVLFLADSVTTGQVSGTPQSTNLRINISSSSRWKYYDNGALAAAAVALSKSIQPSGQAETAVEDQPIQYNVPE